MTRASYLTTCAGVLLLLCVAPLSLAQDKLVGLIPKARQPIRLDGKLDDWAGAFVTPAHVGHPDFANRGAQFLFLWDADDLYVGQRCLDQKPAHVAPDGQLWNGDSVEFYLDTRRGDQLGNPRYAAGTVHLYWTPFTGTEVKPRVAVRNLPALKDFSLKGAEVAAEKTAWGYTAEFKLPWASLPGFVAKAGEVIGIDCELCSSDGGPRTDRTFVYSSPASVTGPASFGRVQLVDKVEPANLKPFGRALLPLSLTKSANYDWLYAAACVSPTLEDAVARLEGKVIGPDGKVKKTTPGVRKTLEGSGFAIWTAGWEFFDLPAGTYSVEVTAYDKANQVLTSRSIPLLHGQPAPPSNQNPSPMVEHTRPHQRLKEETPAGRREKLAVGTLFVPEALRTEKRLPLFVHFHGGAWLPEVAAATQGRSAVISVQLGSGSGVYAKAFADPTKFTELLQEAEAKAGVAFAPVGLTAWSAGYGAMREILKVPANYERVRFVLLIDGLHTGYVGGKPGPLESTLVADDLDIFVRFAQDAAAGKKQMMVTHSEIFPGSFASTTETTDHLLRQLGLRRQPTLQWGPMRTQQLSEAKQGKFWVIGYAGNSAPDHVDQLHSLPEYLKWIQWND